MGFNDFLHRCEMLDFDFDPKLVQHGRMHTRDMHKLKVTLDGRMQRMLPLLLSSLLHRSIVSEKTRMARHSIA